MLHEKSCGIILFHNHSCLMVQSRNKGLWNFPKGHMEQGETEEETALREVKEETGLTAQILPGFRKETCYPLPGCADFTKNVVYFTGTLHGGTLRAQETEVLKAQFVPIAQVPEYLAFDQLQEVFQEAAEFFASIQV